MLRLEAVEDPIREADKIRRWRYGRIVVRAGRLVEIQRRLTCGNVSMAQVWWQAKYGRHDDNVCWIDYHQPLGMPTFLTVDYIRAGTLAGYRSFSAACHVLHEVARIRGSFAIVAHVSNGSISDRLLERFGWEQHLTKWKGRHWIRRFYDGYPESVLERFVDTSRSVAKASIDCGSLKIPRPS